MAKETHQVSRGENRALIRAWNSQALVSAVTLRTGQGSWAFCPELLGLQDSQVYPEGREENKK